MKLKHGMKTAGYGREAVAFGARIGSWVDADGPDEAAQALLERAPDLVPDGWRFAVVWRSRVTSSPPSATTSRRMAELCAGGHDVHS